MSYDIKIRMPKLLDLISTDAVIRKRLKPCLRKIVSKWICTQTVMDSSCVYTGPNGSKPIWLCYLYS